MGGGRSQFICKGVRGGSGRGATTKRRLGKPGPPPARAATGRSAPRRAGRCRAGRGAGRGGGGRRGRGRRARRPPRWPRSAASPARTPRSCRRRAAAVGAGNERVRTEEGQGTGADRATRASLSEAARPLPTSVRSRHEGMPSSPEGFKARSSSPGPPTAALTHGRTKEGRGTPPAPSPSGPPAHGRTGPR